MRFYSNELLPQKYFIKYNSYTLPYFLNMHKITLKMHCNSSLKNIKPFLKPCTDVLMCKAIIITK